MFIECLPSQVGSLPGTPAFRCVHELLGSESYSQKSGGGTRAVAGGTQCRARLGIQGGHPLGELVNLGYRVATGSYRDVIWVKQFIIYFKGEECLPVSFYLGTTSY